ncbi:MAG: zinc ABC transporter permease [Gemmatales bacterium]|nr:MAG: zinc ABC transporter permease [Gemmatales bacterium]
MASIDKWLDAVVFHLARLAPQDTYLSFETNIRGLLAVILVCLICGAVGSMVVGNRMAFFSDALAHCAFAGVGLGLISGLLMQLGKDSGYYTWGVPAIMVVFGVVIGLGIAWVRENTSLASDTVIGVFFAFSVGFGAMIFKAISARAYLSPENFLFGDPTWVTSADLVVLIALLAVTMVVLAWIYNGLVFSSFNLSLARSRKIAHRLYNYAFIILLAMIVNLCLKTVGALLIHGLLIVPAAAAANISRNMRQMFLFSVAISVFVGVGGAWAAMEIGIRDPATGQTIHFGWSGTIVVVAVALFFATMLLRRLRGETVAA